MRFYGGRNLAKAERDLVLATLKQCSNNRAQLLGMPRSTLDKKLKQYAASGVPSTASTKRRISMQGELPIRRRTIVEFSSGRLAAALQSHVDAVVLHGQ
jgi:hypothetical protein